jgi:type IV pilus assembly protein PilF
MRPDLLLAALLLAVGASAGVEAKKEAPARASLSETARTNLAYAQALIEANKFKEAEDRVRKAMSTDPGNGRVHAMMAVVQSRLQRPDKAAGSFERAMKLAPMDAAVHNLRAVWLCESGDPVRADQAFQVALRIRGGPRAQLLANAGRCAVLARSWEKARGYLREAVKLAPNDRNVLVLLSESELQLGRTLEARAFVQRSDALGPDAQTLALAAKVEDAAGDAVAAARYRKRLREEFPGYAPIGEGVRQQ